MDNLNQLGSGETGADALALMRENSMPAVTLRGLTILPGMVIHFDLSREASIASVERAMLRDQRLLVVTQKDPNKENPGGHPQFFQGGFLGPGAGGGDFQGKNPGLFPVG